jgi:hypothetical protein
MGRPHSPARHSAGLGVQSRAALVCARAGGITTLTAIGTALSMPAAEATKLLRGHQWRESDFALLQAKAARLVVRVTG